MTKQPTSSSSSNSRVEAQKFRSFEAGDRLYGSLWKSGGCRDPKRCIRRGMMWGGSLLAIRRGLFWGTQVSVRIWPSKLLPQQSATRAAHVTKPWPTAMDTRPHESETVGHDAKNRKVSLKNSQASYTLHLGSAISIR